jgi:hypothetical protein
MIHMDVTNSQDSMELTSAPNFSDSIQEQKVSLDEQGQLITIPGPSPKGKL